MSKDNKFLYVSESKQDTINMLDCIYIGRIVKVCLQCGVKLFSFEYVGEKKKKNWSYLLST